MLINKKLTELAADAGFIFWENEEWGPGPGNIDWSSQYDQQLQGLYDRMLEEVLQTIDESVDDIYLGKVKDELKRSILNKFGV